MSQTLQQIRQLSIDLIDDPEYAMRTEMDNDSLRELSHSIAEVGLIEPIIVRPKGERYEVVAGHRRLCAVKMANLAVVPAIVSEANESENEMIKVHENLFREDVDPVDEAFFISRALDRLQLTPHDFAGKINRSEQYVKDRLMIISYDDYLIDYIKQKRVPLIVAKYLSQISDAIQRRMFVDYAANNGVTQHIARQWLEESRQGTLPTVTEATDPASLFPDLPRKIWTVDCRLCGGQIPVPEAKLVYAHGSCVDQITFEV